MSWFFIALCAPLLWSVTNHIDKFLLSRYFKTGGISVLLLYSTLFSIFVIPGIYLFHPYVVEANIHSILLGIFCGLLNVSWVYLYMKALSKEETTIVVPFFQLIPFFAYVISYLLLGEVLTMAQILSGLLVITGALILTMEISEEKKFRIKHGVVLLMSGASLILALYDVLFKVASLEVDFWTTTFWVHVGMLIFGVCILAHRKSRMEFISSIVQYGKNIVSVNIASEATNATATMFMNYALILAPVALVLTVNAYQPVFVFLGGVLLTIFFPKIAVEKISRNHLIHKVTAIAIISIGSYFLYLS